MTFRVASKPELSVVEPPENVNLSVGEKRTVHAVVRLPWTGEEQGLLEIEVTPTARGEKGASVKASVLIQGLSAAAPGVGPLALLGGAVAVALLGRARKPNP